MIFLNYYCPLQVFSHNMADCNGDLIGNNKAVRKRCRDWIVPVTCMLTQIELYQYGRQRPEMDEFWSRLELIFLICEFR